MGKLRQLVKMQKGYVSYSDTTAKWICDLPKTATLLYIFVQTVTGFSGSDLDLEIGTKTEPAKFVAEYELPGSAAYAVMTMASGGHLEDLSLNGPVTDIWATVVDGSRDGSAGKALVIVVYADPFVNPGQ